MFSKLKQKLYFPIAWYFRFFAVIKLNRWKPKIIVITGSSGKTTLLHLVESQLGDIARYSHHANSSYGIPFDILGFKRQDLTINEWIGLFLLAPFKFFNTTPKEKIYVVETDCDRTGEGKFLAEFLKPDIVIWTNVSRTHAAGFDRSVSDQSTVEETIAFEFGHFIRNAKEMVIFNIDNELISNQLSENSQYRIISVSKKDLKNYQVSIHGTEYQIENKIYKFPYLLPENVYYSLASCLDLCKYLKIEIDDKFSRFIVPPGRNSIFKGIKNTTIIDSSYNANYDSMEQILTMVDQIRSNDKWLIISDMLEQGQGEKDQHEKVARLLLDINANRIIVMGPRSMKYIYPILKNHLSKNVILEQFIQPRQVLDYLRKEISGSEMLFFKGSRFLEGVIEHLLADKNDINKLCRREKIWKIRRKKWDL